MMKKNDVILIIVILVVTFGFVIGMGVYRSLQSGEDAQVVVTIDGEEYGRYPLDQDMQEKITLEDGSYNVLEIRDGYVSITEADCRDQICVKHMHIHAAGETIVCLPHKLVVTIEGGVESEIDAATH